MRFTLRSAPDGYIATSVTNFISTKVGPVPVAFVVFVAFAFALELGLRKTKFGLRCGRSARTRSRLGGSACPSTGLRSSAMSAPR